MRIENSRRFRVADGLILIAGVAVGLASVRALWPDLTPHQIWGAVVHPREAWSVWYALKLSAGLGVCLGIPLLAAWTPTCLIVQLIRPRPSWRRLSRQPGFVACLITTSAFVVMVVASSLAVWLSTRVPIGHHPDSFIRALVLGGILAGSGVLWSWVTMTVCGICRRRATWTDRLGRLTGVAWVTIGVSSAAYFFLLSF